MNDKAIRAGAMAFGMLAVLVGAPSTSQAFDDGHELLDALSIGVESSDYTEEQWGKRRQFYGYLHGFIGGHWAIQSRLADWPGSRLFCITHEHTVREVSTAVERFVSNVSVYGQGIFTPDESLDRHAAHVMLDALMSGFPCD